MKLSECIDYTHVSARQLYSSDHQLDKATNPYELYTYAINKQCKSDFLEETYTNYFLFRLVPFLPSWKDCKYKIIKEYTSSKSDLVIERNRCIAFELAVRNKNYYLDTNKVFQYYIEHEIHIINAIKIMESRGREYLSVTKNDDISYLRNIIENLCPMVKTLKLVPYKIYNNFNLFLHWGIDPRIYQIVSLCVFYENIEKVDNRIKLINEQGMFYIFNTDNNNEWSNERIIKDTLLTDTAILHQSYKLNDDFLNAQIGHQLIDEEEITGTLKDELQSSIDIEHTVSQTFQYPRITRYSKITFEIELSTYKTTIDNFLKSALKSLDSVFEEESLMQLYIDTDEKEYAVKFFIFDYVTYRLEQIEHMMEFGLLEDVLDIVDKADEDIDTGEFLEHSDAQKKKDVYIKKQLKAIKKSHQRSKTKIYKELEAILDITSDSIKKHFEKISDEIKGTYITTPK